MTGRVAMGIRAGGVDEGADGVTIFYPAKFELWDLLVIMGLSGRYYSDSTRSPSSAKVGTTKSVVFGRVVMGIRARGIDEGADGVVVFYPAKTWALGSTWS